MKQSRTPMLRISVNTRHGVTRISYGVVKVLQNPEYIRLLINREAHQAAIQSALPSDRDRIRVPEAGKLFRFQINSKALTESLSEMMGWQQGATYQIKGQMIGQVIKFELDTASIAVRKPKK